MRYSNMPNLMPNAMGMLSARFGGNIRKNKAYRKYTIGCYASRTYRDQLNGRERKRQKSTVKTDCPFSFLAVSDESRWLLKHRDGPQFARHNHGPTLAPQFHWEHRKLRGDALRQVYEFDSSWAWA